MKQKQLLKKLLLFVLAVVSLSAAAFAEEPFSEEEPEIEWVWSYAEDVDLDVSDWAVSDDPVALLELSPYEQMKASVVKGIQQRKETVYVKNLLDETCTSEEIKQLYFNTLYSFPEETAHVVVTRVQHTKSAAPGEYMAFIPVYLDEQTYDETAFKAAVDAAEAACFRNGMTDLEKVAAVHDWLVLNCQYDPYVANNHEEYTAGGVTYRENTLVYSAYGAFVEGNAVCQGYALAFQALMNRAEIPCYFVSGQNHAWNVVPMDGTWYYVDVTWDDPVDIGDRGDLYGAVGRDNFLKGENTFQMYGGMNGHSSCAPWSTEYGTQLNISSDDYALPDGLTNAADMAAYLIDDAFYLAKENVLYKHTIGSNFADGVAVTDGLPGVIASAAWDETDRALYFLSGLYYHYPDDSGTAKYYQSLYKYALDSTEACTKLMQTPDVDEPNQYTMKLIETEVGKSEIWTWYNYSKVDPLLTLDYYVEVADGIYSYYAEEETVWIEPAENSEHMVLVVWFGSRNEFLEMQFCAESAAYQAPTGAKSLKIFAVQDTNVWIPLCAAEKMNFAKK